jgi:tRNA pseudouridine38-40 synthase
MEHDFLLTVEFDGTDFCGWQRQSSGRSVQGTLESGLERLAGEPTRAVAAGRTDAGVHALGMPVSTTMPDRWTPHTLLRALNAILPRAIAIRRVQRVPPGFNARRMALGRHYRYDIGTDSSTRSPFRGRSEWPLGRSLEFGALTRVASVLPGEHDFRAFAVVGEPKPHYRCQITEARWEELEPGRLRFSVAADRFLHHMVRFLVGTMVDIGLGRRPEHDMPHLLSMTTNHQTSAPAPASGLAFVAGRYPPELLTGESASW